jgi:hypothetical protein
MHINFLKVGRCDGEKLHAMASLLTNSGDKGGRESKRWLGVVFQDGGNIATWQNQVSAICKRLWPWFSNGGVAAWFNPLLAFRLLVIFCQKQID